MSGCVHCVLTLYAEDVEAYEGAALAARAALEAQGVPRSQWPTAVTEREDDEAEAVHPSMAAFLA
jgi:hypothetical protein